MLERLSSFKHADQKLHLPLQPFAFTRPVIISRFLVLHGSLQILQDENLRYSVSFICISFANPDCQWGGGGGGGGQ